MSLFTNGNARVTKLILMQLGAGVVVMILTQVLASLPAQDWLSPKALKITSFTIGIVLTTIKGAELFFSKTASLFKDHSLPDAEPEAPEPKEGASS